MTTKDKTDRASAQAFDVVIVGAGFAGLYMLHQARQLGLRARVLEAGSDVGGTWFWNRYPGARCDIESLEYSYSFSKELQQEWRWPERYAAQPDILKYINHVANRFDLRKDIQLDTRVISATFDDDDNRWRITTEKGESFSGRYCVMATGNLSLPRVPNFPGLDSFKGRWFHSALWPQEEVDFSDRRVGVIGTGSTGIQIIPIVAKQAKQLYVFQRTPNFSVPAVNRPLAPEVEAAHKQEYDERRAEARRTAFGIAGYPFPERLALGDTPDERERAYEAKWNTGGNISFLYAYKDLLVSKEANETACEFVRNKIRSIVKDPAVAEKLLPRDHHIGTKRLCLDTGYFETYNRPNVTLVDVRSDPIVSITPDGLKTNGAAYELDDIIFATGFDAMTGALLDIEITGSQGRSFREKWADGPRTYLGLMTSGYPNLFMVTGPGTHQSRPTWSFTSSSMWTGFPIASVSLKRTASSASMSIARRKTIGLSTSTRLRTRRSIRSPTPGTWGPTSPESRGCSCHMWVASISIATSAIRSPATATEAFSSKSAKCCGLPSRHQGLPTPGTGIRCIAGLAA